MKKWWMIGSAILMVCLSLAGSVLMYQFKEFTLFGFITFTIVQMLWFFAMACVGQRCFHKKVFSWVVGLYMAIGMGGMLGIHLAYNILGGPINVPGGLQTWLFCSIPYIVALVFFGILGRQLFKTWDSLELNQT